MKRKETKNVCVLNQILHTMYRIFTIVHSKERDGVMSLDLCVWKMVRWLNETKWWPLAICNVFVMLIFGCAYSMPQCKCSTEHILIPHCALHSSNWMVHRFFFFVSLLFSLHFAIISILKADKHLDLNFA